MLAAACLKLTAKDSYGEFVAALKAQEQIDIQLAAKSRQATAAKRLRRAGGAPRFGRNRYFRASIEVWLGLIFRVNMRKTNYCKSRNKRCTLGVPNFYRKNPPPNGKSRCFWVLLVFKNCNAYFDFYSSR